MGAAGRRGRRLEAGPRALEAVASPARQELLSALGHGPATVTELSVRLGRSRQALYYHLGVLSGAGLAMVTAWRGDGRNRERVYGLRSDRVAVGARAGSARDLAAAGRAVTAMLRLTGREVRQAIVSPEVRRLGARRELMALRGKARLAPEELRRLNRLLGQVQSLLRGAKSRRANHRLYSVTIVLTPSREAAAGEEGKARR